MLGWEVIAPGMGGIFFVVVVVDAVDGQTVLKV